MKRNKILRTLQPIVQLIFRLVIISSTLLSPIGDAGAVSLGTISTAANSPLGDPIDQEISPMTVYSSDNDESSEYPQSPPANWGLDSILSQEELDQFLSDLNPNNGQTAVEPLVSYVDNRNEVKMLIGAGEQQTQISTLVQLNEPLHGVCNQDSSGAITCDAPPSGSVTLATVPAVLVSTLRGAPSPFASRTASPTVPQQTTVTVDTTSMVLDGDVTSVSALLNDPGPDGVISFLEALTAVNNTGSGHTINFSSSLPHGTTIVSGYTLFLTASNTVIDGDTNGDWKPDILLDGPNGYVSLEITSDNNQIRTLAIAGLNLNGASSFTNHVYNCYIGTDVDGTAARQEEVNGVQIINGAHVNTIEYNVIAGNTLSDPAKGAAGIYIHLGAHNNDLQENRIGLNVQNDPLPNEIGVVVWGGANLNTIGGERLSTDCSDPCNIISGNSHSGIEILGSGTINNKVQGNYIGVKADGTTALPNGQAGVLISDGASQNTIGGQRAAVDCTGPCNVISGNGAHGVWISGSGTKENKVQGNYIGVNQDGSAPAANVWSGVAVDDRATHNTIGGTRPSNDNCTGPCNLISGNTLAGVGIVGPSSGYNTVKGNYIGTDKNGIQVEGMGNETVGVGIVDASDNQVGGGQSGDGNRISENKMGGIYILHIKGSSDATHHNSLRRNVISWNGGQGIDLSPDEGIGVDGPNDDRLPPGLYPVTSSESGFRFTGTSDAPDGSIVDLFEGGEQFISVRQPFPEVSSIQALIQVDRYQNLSLLL